MNARRTLPHPPSHHRARCAAALVAALALAALGGCAPRAVPARTPTIRVEALAVEATVASRDGVPIWYRAEGSGTPALLLVHCWTCDASSWQPTVDSFSGGHRIVTLDLAGHGRSGAERLDWTVEAFAEDVAAVARALDLGPTILVGHSMGAQVAVAAAPLLGERVRGVVVVDSLHDLTQRPDAEERAGLLDPLRADFPTAADRFARRLFPPDADPQLVERVARQMAEAPPEPAVAMIDALWSWDAAAAVRRLTVPLVAINSALYPTNLEGNRQVYPAFDAVILPGVGHFPHLERPAEFAAKLAAIVARLSPAPAAPPPAP